MQKPEEPWHVLTLVCPECCREFQPKKLTQQVRLCPECEKKIGRSSPLTEVFGDVQRLSNPVSSL